MARATPGTRRGGRRGEPLSIRSRGYVPKQFEKQKTESLLSATAASFFCGSFSSKRTQKTYVCTYRVRLHVRVGNPARLTYVSSYVRTRVGNPARHQKTSVIELKDVLQGNVAIDWHRRQHSRSSYLACAWHPRRIVSNCACLIIFLTEEVYGRAST